MQNQRIADIFQEMGEILEIQGENRFRVNSYLRAAQLISSYPHDLREVLETDPKKLRGISGIGEGLAEKIEEILLTGKCKEHAALLRKIGKKRLALLKVRTVGPKKVKMLYEKLGIDSVVKLRRAAEHGQLRELEGMGEKSEAEILKATTEYDQLRERMPLHLALRYAAEYVEYLEKCPAVKKVAVAGSLRRRVETIGDIDILAVGPGAKIIEYFVGYPEVKSVLAQGPTKASVLLKSGIQVDLRVVARPSFGAALYYFTGSKAHNIKVRDRAKRMGLKINEYGVFKVAGSAAKKRPERRVAGATEKQIFKAVKLPFIEPELRENRGEVEAAVKGKLPKLVQRKDIQGDLHSHSEASDGKSTLAEMVEAAQALGYSYLAVTDHSTSVKIAHGLDEKRLFKQFKAIDDLNKRLKGFRILKGSEVDILGDGSLDFPDRILKKLDIVIGSVHTRFNLPIKEQTERVIKAFQNPHLMFFAHPTGRLLGERTDYDIDLEAIIKAAKKCRVAIEINGNPLRLDLQDVYCQMAKENGTKIVINTDSHHFSQLRFMDFGIGVAKRGWLEKKDVLNTLPVEKMLAYWGKK